MEDLEAALERARALDPEALANSIQEIGFECTRCGHCCTGDDGDPHTATIFPNEVRSIVDSRGEDWDAVARPIPYGLDDGVSETFEWALQTDDCSDCRFLADRGDGTACTIYTDRPLICRTYPFSVAIGMSVGEAEARDRTRASAAERDNPGMEGEEEGDWEKNARQEQGSKQQAIAGHQEGVIEQVGKVRAHECPGLGREIGDEQALELAHTLKNRTIEELEQAIGVRAEYDPNAGADEPVVVHDSEGAKRPDGTRITRTDDG